MTPSLTGATLDRILGRLTTAPIAARRALRDWCETDPEGFTRLAIERLAGSPHTRTSLALASLLAQGERYLDYLADPAKLSPPDAVNVARLMTSRDKRFYIKLNAFTSDFLPDDRITRILQIAEGLGAAGLMVPWMRRMTQHPDEYIRQKAVMIMCQAGTNPLLVERQLKSPDARVRANAVESLWTVHTPAARSLLEHASHDPHHRVAINALVGLFRRGESSALGRIIYQARNPSPAFRVAAAWALGLTARPEAWPALKALEADPVPRVRESASRAIAKVPEPPADRPIETPAKSRAELPPELHTETLSPPETETVDALVETSDGPGGPQFRLIR